MKYLDTNVFLAAILPQTSSETARSILTQVAEGTLDAATSCLTWDEFLWVLRRTLKQKDITEESKKFLHFPHLTFLDITSETLEKAHTLIATYDIRPRDALHAATALQNGIKEIISEDADFDRIRELKRIPLHY